MLETPEILDSEVIVGPVLTVFNYSAIALFAATGALAAARKGQTIMTLVFFGLLAGLGGGTVRDILIDAPVFWINNNAMPGIALIAALLVWIIPQSWWPDKLLDWLDAAGLATYAVYGAARALDFGVDPMPAFLMGIITACAGGIVRDVLVGETSLILEPEIYITAAALASGIFVGMKFFDQSSALSAIVAVIAGFVLRGAAIQFKIVMPGYDYVAGPGEANV